MMPGGWARRTLHPWIDAIARFAGAREWGLYSDPHTIAGSDERDTALPAPYCTMTTNTLSNPEERRMATQAKQAGWKTVLVLVGRLIFTLVFTMAVSFKLMDIGAT